MNIKKYIYKLLGGLSFFILFGTLDPANYFSAERTVIQSCICVSIMGLSKLRCTRLDIKKVKEEEKWRHAKTAHTHKTTAKVFYL